MKKKSLAQGAPEQAMEASASVASSTGVKPNSKAGMECVVVDPQHADENPPCAAIPPSSATLVPQDRPAGTADEESESHSKADSHADEFSFGTPVRGVCLDSGSDETTPDATMTLRERCASCGERVFKAA